MSHFKNQRKQDLQNMKKNATPYGNARDLVNAATNAFQKDMRQTIKMRL